jgi:hypothetical protein
VEGGCAMAINNMELDFFQLKRLETALEVFSYKQKQEKGCVNEELLKKRWKVLSVNFPIF